MLATLTVNTTLDLVDPNDGLTSLREAIEQANASPNVPAESPDVIEFDLPADDPGHVYYRDDGVPDSVSIAMVASTTQSADGGIADIDPDWPHSWFTIEPSSQLPGITESLVIDGYSQDGAIENSNPVGMGLNSVLRIEINGNAAGAIPDGMLNIVGGGGQSTIRGLTINRVSGVKVLLADDFGATTGNNRLEGNYIGPDVSGTQGFPDPGATGLHGFPGVRIGNISSQANVIGGLTPPARNLISANPGSGVLIADSSDNRVEGNLVGTDRAGVIDLGNSIAGIAITRSRNTVGGQDEAAANVVSGNLIGIQVSGRDATVENNFVGTDVSGTSNIGNDAVGILATLNVSGARIAGNRVAYNGAAAPSGGIGGTTAPAGIRIDTGNNFGSGNLITENSIFSNFGPGIDLDDDGVTGNDVPPLSDPPDRDSGPNDLQNYPVLSSVSTTDLASTIGGSLHSSPNSSFRIEFFTNTDRNELAFSSRGSAIVGEFGEGRTYLGSIEVNTDANGTVDFSASGLSPIPIDQPFVTATATDITDDGSGPRNNTSEFSAVIPLGGCSSTVSNTQDTGTGTLREAIICANLSDDLLTLIDFDIPATDSGHYYYLDDGQTGSVSTDQLALTDEVDDVDIPRAGAGAIDPDWPHSWFSIRPTRPLPNITQSVAIDGYSQNGSQQNTIPAPGGLDSVLKIEISGLDSTTASGITLSRTPTVIGHYIRGLAINNWDNHGILKEGGDGIAFLYGIYVGSDISGTVDVGNSKNGIFLVDQSGAVIGESEPSQRNLIAGNDGHGIHASGGGGHTITGNLIGTNRRSDPQLGNEGNGILIDSSSINTIAGSTVSDNALGGITIIDSSVNNGSETQTNTLASLTPSQIAILNECRLVFLNHASELFQVEDFIEDVMLGLPPDDETGAEAAGRQAAAKSRIDDCLKRLRENGLTAWINPIREGRVEFNGNSPGLGIDLGGDGVTANDISDGDSGPNGLQNFPVLATATVSSSATTIAGTIRSLANESFSIAFFSNGELDPSGHGEGGTFLGRTTVITDDRGEGEFSFDAPPVQAGVYITSTATWMLDTDDDSTTPLEPINTSEFSLGIEVTAASDRFDFGDAPQSYGTLASDNGARHTATGPHLGIERDVEVDAVASGPNTFDGGGDDRTDNGGLDDEDGVILATSIASTPGSPTTSSFLVTASAPAMLDAWVDFDRDGTFQHPAEHLGNGASIGLNGGANIVSFSVPGGASIGDTFARFRISTAGGLGPIGSAEDGEVEDHPVEVLDGQSLDARVDLVVGEVELFADGSDVVASDGANELFRLAGAGIDSLTIVGTDSGDTLSLGDLSAAIPASTPLAYDGGSGNDTLRSSRPILDLVDTALIQLSDIEVIDLSAPETTRLVVDASSVVAATGGAGGLLVIHDADDEVHFQGSDWKVDAPIFSEGTQRHVVTSGNTLVEVANTTPWQNPLDPLDVSRNGETTPLDALKIINRLSASGQTSIELPIPQNVDGLPEEYLDVSGNGTASPLDALLIINFLRSLLAEQEQGVRAFEPDVDLWIQSFARQDSVQDEREEPLPMIRLQRRQGVSSLGDPSRREGPSGAFSALQGEEQSSSFVASENHRQTHWDQGLQDFLHERDVESSVDSEA